MSKTTLFFIRHGESAANAEKRFAGHTDFPLTERGHRQAELTAQFLKDVRFDAVYASDLRRAFDTAEHIARLQELPVIPEPDLREIHAGEWEGMLFDSIQTRYPEKYAVWLQDIGRSGCVGGETVAQLQQRIRCTVERLAAKHPGQTLCIGTHATPIRVMECIWRGVPLSEMKNISWVVNASVTVAEYENGTGKLLRRNECEHLATEMTLLPLNV